MNVTKTAILEGLSLERFQELIGVAWNVLTAEPTWTCETCDMRGRPADTNVCANCGAERRSGEPGV
jgi:hypothetical protein